MLSADGSFSTDCFVCINDLSHTCTCTCIFTLHRKAYASKCQSLWYTTLLIVLIYNSHCVSPENASDDGARVDDRKKEWILVCIIAQVVVVYCE